MSTHETTTNTPSNVKPEDWMARAALFELLAMGLLMPTTNATEALVSGGFAEACKEVCTACKIDASEQIEALSVYKNADATVLFHTLRTEYTSLFALPSRPLIAPYVGVWKMGKNGAKAVLMVNPESMAIERFMRRCGVTKNLSAGQSNDPLDHIGTVCEFLEYLCLVAAKAIQPNEGTILYANDFAEFLDEFFSEYATWCASEILKTQPSSFYSFIAHALNAAADFNN